MTISVTFHGAAGSVTGSQHLVDVDGFQILLDCGSFQGPRDETYRRNLHFPFDPRQIDVCILSHAHIDHSGNIPNLVKQGFRGDIVCTPGTRDLCVLMLQDSGKIQESDIEYLNRKRRKNRQAPLEPIYTINDAIQSLKQFVTVGYQRPYQIRPGIRVTFLDAGHILGSAIVVLDIDGRGDEPARRLVFSGDIGRPGRPILNDPTTIDHADYLIMESTYGDRLHSSSDETDFELEQIIKQTYKRGGKVIVPAFAVGRTQELVYRLNRMVERRDLPAGLHVFVDSPLATDVTTVYRSHPEAYDHEAARALSDEADRDIFGFRMMRYTQSVAESKQLNFLDEPAVIISASGMAESGRILHHLKNNIEDSANTVLLVGFMAENTLGRRLAERHKRVRIFGEEYQVHARIEKVDGLSAHADRDELLQWADHINPRPRATFLVHGEKEASEALAESLRRDLAYTNVNVPHLGQHVIL